MILAIVEYYHRALMKGKSSMLSFAIQPLSFIFIVYVVSDGRFLSSAIAGAMVSFIVGVGIADLSIELVGMKVRSKFYDIFTSLPGRGIEKTLGISIGMSLPALPYVIVLGFFLTMSGGVENLLRILFAVTALWLWSVSLGTFLGARIKEPLTVMRFSTILTTLLTVFPPVYYPLSVVPEPLRKSLLLIPTVSASTVMSGEKIGLAFISLAFWAVIGVFMLLKFELRER
ncbi:multidrug transporter [Thermococcus sp.]|uniref:multidrug transporter n=1 Tax=Thermococcus sp. TaxID=35749 RepID=UPI0025F1C494|nr:multidrug transporter [Thermococcus sp.]